VIQFLQEQILLSQRALHRPFGVFPGDVFPGRETIRIGIRPEIPDRVEISFSRRGNSFPGLSPEPESPSFGRELIQTLVDQLGGNLSTERGEWTTWKIDFSLSDNRIKSGGRL